MRWQDVCLPKAEGGLGLKDILSWNTACMIKHIWQIFAQAGTIWIAWIYAYILKERNIWQISVTQNNSWNWRKLLQLKSLARQFVEVQDREEVWKLTGAKCSIAEV